MPSQKYSGGDEFLETPAPRAEGPAARVDPPAIAIR